MPRWNRSAVLLLATALAFAALSCGRAPSTGAAAALPSEVVAAAQIPLTGSPLLSPEFKADDPAPGQRRTSQLRVACGASNCLMTSLVSDSGFALMRRVNLDGTVLDAQATVLGPGDVVWIAYAAGTFLLEFERQGVLSLIRVRESDGAVLGTVPSPPPSQVASNGSEFLLAYRTDFGTYAAVRMLPDGTVLDAPPIGLYAGESSSQLVAVVAAGHDFLAAIRVGTGATIGVSVVRVREDGTVVPGATTALPQAFRQVDGVTMTFDGTRVLLAAGTATNATNASNGWLDMTAVRLDPTGAPLDATPMTVAPASSVGSNESVTMFRDGAFLVAWRKQRVVNQSGSDIHARRVDPASGAVLDASDIDLSANVSSDAAFRFAQASTGIVVTLERTSTASVGQLMGAGAAVHVGPLADVAPGGRSILQVAVATSADVALVVWLDPNNIDVNAARVSLVDGRLLDTTPLRLAGPTAFSRTLPAVAASGQDFLVAWALPAAPLWEARSVHGADGTLGPLLSQPVDRALSGIDVAGFPGGWTIVLTQADISSKLTVVDVNPDGTMDRATQPKCCTTAIITPQITPIDSDTAVVLFGAGVLNSNRLSLVRYDRRSHAVIDATPLPVAATVSSQRLPRLTRAGNELRVLWYEQASGGPTTLHGASFDAASAAPLSPDTVLVADATGSPVWGTEGLDVASDAAETWVLWDDERAGIGSVRASRILSPMALESTVETLVPPFVTHGPAAASFGDGAFVAGYARIDPFDGSARPKVRCFGRAPHPAGADQVLALHENAALDVPLPADVPPSMVEFVQSPAHGSVTAGAGKLTYTPTAGYTGPDRLRWRMRNCLGTSATWTVDLTVETWPPAPVATAGSATTDEDTSVRLVLTASSPSGAPPQFRLATGPAHGSLTAPGLSPTYTPDPDWNGTDTFSWYVDDGFHRSATVDETIVVRPVNDLPTLDPASFTTPADVPLDVHVTARDPDGDAVTFTLIGLPTHGTLAGSGPDWVYTPDALYVGSDAFTVRPSDPSGPGLARAFALTVTARNHPPAAHAATVGVDQNTAISLTISADDADGDALLFVVTDGPHHGTLTGSAPALTYTPAPEYWGPDAFVFTASDAGATSTARVTIDVRHVNRPPVPRALAVTTDEDVPVALTLAADDADGDALTYTITTAPAHGSLTGTAPGLTYSPSARFFGTDAFSFTVSDGTATVAGRGTVTVRHVNHAPEAEGASHAATEDVTLSFDLAGHDPDGDALTFQVVTPPAHGTVAIDANHVEYTPAPDFHGDDALAFTVSDGSLASAPAQVVLQVASVNDAPVAKDLRVQVVEDDAVAVTLAGTDADGDALFFDILEPPTVGRLTGTAPAVTYVSKPLSRAGDRFRYRAFDGFDWSAPAEVEIVVLPRNHAPFATGASVVLDEDGSAAVRFAGADPDGDALGFEVTQAPAHGTLTGTAPDLTYAPAPDFSGPDEIRFVTFDADMRSTEAIVAVTVRPVEDAPVAQGTTVATEEDTPVEIVLAASDVDGDALVPRFVRAPLHGTLEASEAGVVYRPEVDFHGPDAFSWVAFDGVRESAPVEVAIDVAAVNDAPVAAGDALETVSGRAVEVVLAGADVDGDGLTFRVVEPPGHGALSGTPPLVAYASEADFEGDDVFTFVANDGAVDSAEAQVVVHVGHRNRAPVAVDQALEAFAGEPLAVHLAGSDAEGQGLSFVIVEGPAHGRVEGVPPDVVYVAEADFVGADAFTFTASDGAENSAPGTIRVDVRRRPVPPTPPSVADVALETRMGTPVEVVLQATGESAEAAVFAIVSEPGHGRASLDGARLTYVPAEAFVGDDGFTYQASVGELRSAPAMVRVRVNPTPAGPPVQVPSGGCGCSGGGGAMAVLGLMGWRRRSRRC